MTDLFKIFQGLREQSSGNEDTILVHGIPNRVDHKIGVSKEGLPLFFIATEDTNKVSIDIDLKLIQVAFQKNCKLISKEGDKSDGIYTIVSLKTDSEDIGKYFVNTLHNLVKQLELNPSFVQIKTELNNLINLFRSLSKPAKKTIQGLWTELLFINQSNDVEYVIKSWHKGKNDRYDFNDGIDKVEIKSTSKNDRIHRFSLSQLKEIKDTVIIIGSTFTVETGKGINANDLIETISEKVSDPSLILKIYHEVAETMGDEFENIFDIYFDYNLALNSIQYFDVRDIPNLSDNFISPAITNVKYDCNLSNVNSIATESNPSQLLKALAK
jgi:hypothetical protein